MSNLRSTVSSGVSGIKGSFSSLSSLASSAYRWGSDICSQMAAGVRAAAGAVISAARSVASSVSSLLHFSVPDEGPLADADTYMPDFMELLAKGITKNQKLVTGAVSELAGSMSTSITDPVGNLEEQVEKAFARITSGIRDSLASAAGSMGSLLVNGLSGTEGRLSSLWDSLKNLTGSAMEGITETVRQGVSDMGAATGQFADSLSSLGNHITSLGNTFGSDFAVSVGTGISRIGSAINDVAGIIREVGQMKDSLQTVAQTFSGLNSAIGSTGTSSGLLSNLGNVLKSVTADCGGLGDGISSLLSKLGGFGDGLSGLVNNLANAGSGLSKALSGLGGGIGKTVSSLMTKVGGLGSSLSGIVSSLGSGLTGLAGSAGSAITGLIGSAGSALSGLAASAGTALSGVAASAGGFLASAGTALAGLAGPAGIAVAAAGAVGVGIKSLWDNCDGFREGVTNVWNSLKNAVSGAASAIASGASKVWNGVKSVASSAISWGKDICSGLANGIKSAASGVFNAAKSVAKGIASLLHFSVPDEGPLSDADTYMPDFMALLRKGITGNMGTVLNQVKAFASQLKEQMQGTGDGDLFGFEKLRNLKLPKIDLPKFSFPQPAFAGMAAGGATTNNTTNNNQKTTNLGGVHITVNGYNARNDDELARVVADKINGMISEDDAVFK